MNIEIFPDISLSDTEQTIVANALGTPAVKKYFRSLANQNGKDIVFGEPQINETAESYLRRQAAVKGRLEVLNTLLQIQAIVDSNQQ